MVGHGKSPTSCIQNLIAQCHYSAARPSRGPTQPSSLFHHDYDKVLGGDNVGKGGGGRAHAMCHTLRFPVLVFVAAARLTMATGTAPDSELQCMGHAQAPSCLECSDSAFVWHGMSWSCMRRRLHVLLVITTWTMRPAGPTWPCNTVTGRLFDSRIRNLDGLRQLWRQSTPASDRRLLSSSVAVSGRCAASGSMQGRTGLLSATGNPGGNPL